MSINLDQKLSAILKSLLRDSPDAPRRQKAAKEFNDLKAMVVSAEFKAVLETVFAECSRPACDRKEVSPQVLVRTLCELRQRQFIESASLVFNQWIESLAVLELTTILDCAPDASSLEAWRSTGKMSVEELEGIISSSLADAYLSVGGDWILWHGSPAKAYSLWGQLLARRERPKHLQSWSEVLGALIKDDKRGTRLELALKHSWPNDQSLATLAEVIRESRTLLKHVVELASVIICKKDVPDSGVTFIKYLFVHIPFSTGAEREFLCALQARIGTGILIQDRRGPQAEAVLSFLGESAKQMRNSTLDESLKQRSWVFENLGHEYGIMGGRTHVTVQGARLVVSALDKASQNLSTKDILEATARNLGMVPVNRKGESIVYDPLKHQDIAGGLLPGDNVVVEEPGWALGSDVVRRPTVRKRG